MHYIVLVADNINYDIVFLCRAPQAVLGWKASALMVIHITTTQRQEVESFLLNYYWIILFLDYILPSLWSYRLVITTSIPLTSQSPAGRSQQTFPLIRHLGPALGPAERGRVRRNHRPLSQSHSQEERTAPMGLRHLRRLKSLNNPASSLKSQRSASGWERSLDSENLSRSNIHCCEKSSSVLVSTN